MYVSELEEIGEFEVLIKVTPCKYPSTRWTVKIGRNPKGKIPDTCFWEDDFWFRYTDNKSKVVKNKEKAKKLIKKWIAQLNSDIEDWNAQTVREGWTETISFEVKDIGK
jgi:hypothetical protein